MKRLLPLFFSLLLLFNWNISKATHASAMELYFYWVSDSTYNFTLTFYRDCQGFTAGAPNQFTLQATSLSTSSSASIILPRLPITGTGVPPLEPTNLLNCAPNNSSCFEEYVYRNNITLPKKARDWVFTTSLCCVPPEVDNIGSGSMKAIAGMNNLDFPDSIAKNISPVWHTRRPNIPGRTQDTIISYPILTYCELRNYLIDQSVKEYQGDRVKYEFVTPDGGFVTPYSLSYSLPTDTPPPFAIDSANGRILYRPIAPASSSGNRDMYLINVKAMEYRMDTDLVNGNYVSVEKMISYQVRNIFILTTDSANCPDLGISFSDSASPSNAASVIDITCDNNPIKIALTEKVLCSSVDSNASHVLIIDTTSGDTVKVNRSTFNCSQNNVTGGFRVHLDSILDPGGYYLFLKTGDDGNTVVTECGMELIPFRDTLLLNVTASPPKGEIIAANTPLDTVYASCNAEQFSFQTTADYWCSSLMKDGSDIRITDLSNNQLVAVLSASTVSCSGKKSNQIRVKTTSGIPPGVYEVQLVMGNDSNSLIDECYRAFDTNYIYLYVNDISVSLGPDITYCEGEPFDTTINAGSTWSQYLWSNGSLGNSIQVDTAGKYWVKVTDAVGCEATDTLEVKAIDCYVGIGENDKERLDIFPNPSSGEFHFVFRDVQEEINVQVKDLTGKLLMQERYLSVNRFDLQLNQSGGVYLTEIRLKSGKVITRRIVIAE